MRAFTVACRALVLFALIATPFAATAEETAATESVAPLSPEDSALLSQALVFDPAAAAIAPTTSLRLPRLPAPPGLAVDGYDRPDGSGTVAITQPLPGDWHGKFGVDLNVAAAPPASYQPGAPLPGSVSGDSSGAAWALVGVSNLASVNVRIDSGRDQGRLGTTLQHSIPLGGDFSLTLRDSYAVTDTLGAFDTAPAAPSGLPLMALPQASGAAAAEPVWSNERGVKFNILPTGTTLGAEVASISNDPVTHNTLSADQKLFGALHVTTAVTDLGEPTVNKSITAAFKLNW